MIFTPKILIKKGDAYRFGGEVSAVAHPCFAPSVFAELWQGFTFRTSVLKVDTTDRFVFSVGSAAEPTLDGYAYAINVEKNGFCVAAGNEKDLILGFMTLLDRIRAVDTEDGMALELDACEIKDAPDIQNRMIHYCVFPETELYEIQRFFRVCAALKFSHVVIEFWGMLKYDCLAELVWPCAFTKDQLRPIIGEARELGLEIIPMFNHWGHASAGRVRHGKHVVLDQNPSLQTYFTEDGWCWDISKTKVRALLREIRHELCELCGEGRYFHIGCDEAYNFEFSQENMDFLCDFINEISTEMIAQGRRAIAWGDMFLYRHPHYNPKNLYVCNAPAPEVEAYMLDRLSRDVIIADWQYDAPEFPVETSAVFVKAGFDTLICPWDRSESKLKSCTATAREQGLFGVMHTTWHTLSAGATLLPVVAVECFGNSGDYKKGNARTHAAAVFRKVYFVDGDYARAGWSKIQVSDVCT
ncbi:MAG: family 20 glycosylhydrolase [Clostridia bacterium]|nr:family 20 glycosylhydrolase [Clostridia bacterium]